MLIKLGNPLSRQKRGARCFIIKEERDTAANTVPVNEKHRRVLQDLEISITWQRPPHSPIRRIIQPPPPAWRCRLRDKCSSTACRYAFSFVFQCFEWFEPWKSAKGAIKVQRVILAIQRSSLASDFRLKRGLFAEGFSPRSSASLSSSVQTIKSCAGAEDRSIQQRRYIYIYF